jgi:peptidoglycan hydrolase-like protein with peptidoglycan-binding domain
MTKRFCLCIFACLLLMGTTPVFSAAAKAARKSAGQTSTRSSKKKSKSKKKGKSTPAGQKAPTPDRIRDIQTALNREGAYTGEPTGKWDNATVEAMKKYQGDNGINPTGKIDALTLNKLKLGSETAGKGAPIPPAPSVTPSPTPAK